MLVELLLPFIKLIVFACGIGIAWFELEYIVFEYSKKTPLALRVASALQAAGAALFVFNPLICGSAVIAARSIFSWYSYTWKICR